MNDAVLTLEGVRKSFAGAGRRVTALDGVSACIRRGAVTGLIGPDGAGKTTLMRLAAGLLAVDGGRIEVLGIDVAREPQRVQSAIGYMPQRFGLYEDLSVGENLGLYADMQAVPRPMRAARYKELTRMTGLEPFTKRLAGRLSGGMKQKLGLACALVRPPRLLLLDEPTVGVDPVSRRELWSIVYGQVKQAGMTVLLSTAYLDEAERCAEVILLHEGRLLAQETPADFSRPLAGRVFLLQTDGLSIRALQSRLARAPGVLDALVTGDRVRIVTDEGFVPDAASLLPDHPTTRIEPVAPRFEDAFVARLKGQDGARGAPPKVTMTIAGKVDDEVIRVRDLERRFGDFRAVKGISFTVGRGEIFGLLGANGAGKTTTFRMLCGLLPASAGELAVAGHDLRRAGARARRSIGYMAQRFSLYGNLTVMQNLRFFSSAYGLRGGRRAERMRWALDGFELNAYQNVNAGLLPLGYKQRLAFAVALMHQPAILFLDEPTSGVDPLARREFWARTNALAEAGVTVLVTTHFMEEANYCDRLVIMADGDVLAAGRPHEIRERASTAENPEPSMEDAFIALVRGREAAA